MAKILVIDDDNFIKNLICKTLRKKGFKVLEAGNGNEGLEQIQDAEPPDLVITDILMPDKEGLETISEIRALNADISIIAMSGGGEMQNMSFLNLAKNIGAQKTLKKPFKSSELLDAVNELLGSKG